MTCSLVPAGAALDRVHRTRLHRSSLRGAALALLGALAAPLAGCSGGSSESPPRPDVVVVVIDTLRADRLAFYGAEEDPAPFLSELAAQSLVFEEAWSTSSWTAPATASLFTSLHPFQHGVETGLVHYEHHREDGARARRLPASVETLPEVMRRLGYRTFGITDNINVGERLGFERGFERFVQTDYAGAAAVNETLDAWADEIRGSDQPTFVYLHYMDPHEPYHLRADTWREPDVPALKLADVLRPDVLRPDAQEPPSFYGDEMVSWIENGRASAPLGQRARQAQEAMLSVYDSEIGWVDRHVREAFELLGDDGSALVVLASDHGEEFGDHGKVAHDFRLYDELVHVPLVLRLPSAERTGRVEGSFSLVDILPTLRAYLGDTIEAPTSGFDLLAPAPAERSLFAARVRYSEGAREELRATRRGRLKAILGGSGGEELYDLERDPKEIANLAGSRPAELGALSDGWAELFESAARVETGEAAPTELDPATIEHLKELGYTSGD